MADGTWKHFEFQSKDGKTEDLKRFRSYEALTSYQHKVDVYTYVLYSGDIENPVTEFTSGFNTYRVWPIIMKGTLAEKVFEDINGKLESGQPLTKKDLVPLTLCALMGGSMPQKERMKRAFDITRIASQQQDLEVDKIEAVMYAMAEKFLDSVSLEELKEAVGMTRLGQMLVNDGIEKGVSKAKLEIAKELLDVLDDEVIAQKTGLSLETVKGVREEAIMP